MATYKVSFAAIERAIVAAGPHGEEVARVLYQDIGRPLPPKEPPAADAPFGSYHKAPKGVYNAAVEGAAVKETEPVAEPEAASTKEANDDTQGRGESRPNGMHP